MIWNIFYPDEFTIDDVYENAAFVYMIQFTNTNEYYFGVKQVYKALKDVSKLTHETRESNWFEYLSSSKSVKERIQAGEPFRKTILWMFPTLQQASNLETALISIFGTHPLNINQAIMTKQRLKKDNGYQFSVLQRIMGDLS
ncbi:hypothetical protein [Mangrovibacter plantisponsor]|uniref:Putative endonuclease SegE-like GIY-YIG domain-containing protein n=1 Tax=Mangrovibacter plantisponsor TaxID=451513 RepID=A0A317PTJ9_9ENTR|nr:hypothetical protein [Mangrovibacter plantisponsor]PWW04993.1 hypothetical protein DES37_11489 [Mangrovibacter plantisponsor]